MEHVRFFRFLFGGFAATRFVGHAFPDKNHQRLFDIPNVQAAFVFPVQIHLLVKRQQAGGEIQLFVFGEISENLKAAMFVCEFKKFLASSEAYLRD